MKYSVEMGSGAKIYTPDFMKFGSAIQKIRGEGEQRHADNMQIA
jgi:hypothetical protein